MTGDMTAQDSLRLYGRTTELADVAALLERLRSGPGGALVVAGDPGLGRSALLEHAMRGFGAGAALLVRAEPGERHLPSSGLRSLLASHAQVLGPAPRSPDGPPEPGELLDALGSRRGSGGPLLVCVDDADLWDAGSRAALGFAARRAGRLRGVGLLLTVAGRRVDSPEFAGVPAVRLRPLDDGAAGELLDELTGGSCPSAVREELLHEAAGNPALLTALADRLTASQLSGVAPLPRPLADGGVLMRVAGGRLAELAPDAGTLLLLVAAAQELAPEGPGADAALVLRAARAAGVPAGALDAAEAAGIVRTAGSRIRFDDPLLRRAVHAGAPLSRRRAAHSLLAAALHGVRHRLQRLLHRAMAAQGPDPRLAGVLAAVASSPDIRAGHGERAVALARAGELSAAGSARTARFTAGAEHARLAGLPHRARELLAAAGEGPAHDAVRGSAELVRGTLTLQDGPVGDAYGSLLLAASLLGPYDPERALVARLTALAAAWSGGDHAACVAALSGVGRGPADDYRTGMLAALSARLDEARAPLRRVMERAEAEQDPERLVQAGSAALVLGNIAGACHLGARALAAARSHDVAAYVPRALEQLAYAELRAGRHTRARAHAEEGLRVAHRAGQRNTAAHHHAVLAFVAAVEGDAPAVARHADAALAVAGPHGLAQAATLAEWARGLADLGRGLAAEAVARLGPLVRPGHRTGHFALRWLALPCFVEAAVLAGEREETAAAVEEFALWAAQGADPQASAQLARCRALLAPPAAAEESWGQALARHELAGGDFERGRTLLLYGMWLRRRRRLREARGRLRDALCAFERCGARVWADQTRAELRATGGATGGSAGPLERLTPQQLRIARCVADGATNREVALRLSVSPRTVDHHLRNVFAALGVRSRVELSRLVDRAEKRPSHP
ncbi:LuxR C-terminal-related transcriptional regulator [Streptomyces zhihengii]